MYILVLVFQLFKKGNNEGKIVYFQVCAAGSKLVLILKMWSY